MYQMVLKILWPYIGRYLAGRAADYLAARRERRKQQDVPAATEELETPVVTTPPPDNRPGWLARDGFWYTLSGIILGSAVTLALVRLMGQDESPI